MIKCILVVEDHVDNRDILRDLLTTEGYELIEAMNGKEALEKAATRQPDLILMDIQLPILDGYEATRILKSDPILKSIPIVVITSYAMSGDAEKAYSAGCDAYISKPIDHQVLLEIIRNRLR